MSLLMKALEKAAKDRGEARTEPAPATTPASPSPAPGSTELSLEPITPALKPQFARVRNDVLGMMDPTPFRIPTADAL